MPTIYENEGHRKSMMKNYHRMVWRLAEWRKSPLCRFCGKVTHNLTFSDNWKDKCTLDHKLARALGGTDTEENFELLCGKCNHNKSKVESKVLAFMQKYGKFAIDNNVPL